MGVECGRDSSRGRPVDRVLHPFGSPLEVVATEGRRGACLRPPGDAEPELVLVGGEDDRSRGAGGRKDLDRGVEERQILAEALLARDLQRRERADEGEPVVAEQLRHRGRVRAEIPRRTELDPCIAELAHRLEHPPRRDEVVAVDRPLPHTPRARRARERSRQHGRDSR